MRLALYWDKTINEILWYDLGDFQWKVNFHLLGDHLKELPLKEWNGKSPTLYLIFN
jgi:hypothetical protein